MTNRGSRFFDQNATVSPALKTHSCSSASRAASPRGAVMFLIICFLGWDALCVLRREPARSGLSSGNANARARSPKNRNQSALHPVSMRLHAS